MDLLSGVTVSAPVGSVARVYPAAGGVSVVFKELPKASENAAASSQGDIRCDNRHAQTEMAGNANDTAVAGVDRMIGEFEDFCTQTARRSSQGCSRLLAEIEAWSLDAGIGLPAQDGFEAASLELANKGAEGRVETAGSREGTEKDKEKPEEMPVENTELKEPSPGGARQLWDPGPFLGYAWRSEVLDYGRLLKALQQEGVFRSF